MVESGLFSSRERETDLLMDFAELTKIIYSRIQRFEPDNTARIFGCIFLREPDKQEMVQLAYGSDAILISYINDAKADLGTKSPPNSSQFRSHNYSVTGLQRFSKSPNLHTQSRIYGNGDCYNYSQNLDNQFIGFDDPYDNMNNLSGYMSGLNMYDPVVQRRGLKSSVPALKRPCHYYVKGMCKNGVNCSYSHHNIPSDFSESDTMSTGSGTGATPASLEKLEIEIVELLRSNTGQPVSIASLPTLYGQMYGKGLQADGYLTESQRHGKAGYSLTKLLCRLNKIAVIERPHGQHAVVLAEDAFRYVVDSGNEKNDATPNPANQIYLTFPADSMFTEADVHAYFSQYGPVRDVRIPCQDRRMFGFVSFHNPETVHVILANRHPHFICGARVLVKPYREKARHSMEKIKPQLGYNLHQSYFDSDIYSMPGELGSSMVIKRQLYQEKMAQMELERMQLNKLGFNPTTEFSSPDYKSDIYKYLSDQKEFDLIDPVKHALDALNKSPASNNDSASSPIMNNSSVEKDSCPVELPENPFGTAQ